MQSFGERVALNMPIQGTAADVMKLAMAAVWKRLRAEKPQAEVASRQEGLPHSLVPGDVGQNAQLNLGIVRPLFP